MLRPLDGPRLLAGPPLGDGFEPLAAHRARLGPLPRFVDGAALIGELTQAGLLGRGGAGFPVGRKWTTVAGRPGGRAFVLANGAEGEPLSAKDRVLMATRPHLVLDGAQLAAEAVDADEVVMYVGREHRAARSALSAAITERAGKDAVRVNLVTAPPTYVAGEETAAVHYLNEGDARPTGTINRPFERGIAGDPTLVQNVESLAHAALIARHGAAWYRSIGGETAGSALVTIGGVERHGVTEIAIGTPIAELAERTGAPRDSRAILLGGYFGGWLSTAEARDLPLDPVVLRSAGSAFGCGVVAFLAPDSCGVAHTARILDFMAGQSAAQCGPCVFGLRAIADATARLAAGSPARDDLARIRRWSEQLAGRGACRHPDGAVGLLRSALRVFDDEFETHQRTRSCPLERHVRRVA
jgi:NADH:ubiquinone oxidoreductase subunit F (NADH-binding)